MKLQKLISLGALAFCLLAFNAHAGGHGPSWDLVGAQSKVAFGSVKLDAVGETHRFNTLSGTVNDYGVATIEIDLASVDTGIEIRDTRMKRHVFEGKGPAAALTATIDPKAMNDLAVGATDVINVSGKLTLGENTLDISTGMFIAKLSDDRVLVTTDEMIMVGADALGITAGVDKLMELARLPSIGRVVPVTLRFVFDKSK
ncbi:hypothetical protein AB833_13645 [Chromatiales bacterium (ex Bugula neritina AB1)]|nr:hypothetical protein AB833_13645 [Chromatiales bacterium (ex Bugula neritina AB1)]